MRFLLICLLCGAAVARDKQPVDPALVQLIEKIDEKSETVHTLRADFVQRKEISLLKDPVTMNGVIHVKKPDGIRFEFEPEDDLIILITGGEMVSLSPKAKKAGRIKMKKRHGRFAQKILSDKIKNLTKYFKVSLTDQTESGGEQHLLLKPAKRKLKKRFSHVEIWFNADHLITRIMVTLADGDVYDLLLSNIEINNEIPDETFDATIPDDFEMGDRMEHIFGAGVTF